MPARKTGFGWPSRQPSVSWRRPPSRSATPSIRACLAVRLAGTRGVNADGDVQKDLDVFADDIFLDAMRHAPVALYASEELEHRSARQGCAAGHCHRPARRLLQHRHQCVDRNDFLPPPRNWRAGRQIRPPLSCSPARTSSPPASSSTDRNWRWSCRSAAARMSSCFSTRLGTFVQAYESRIIPPRTQEFAINAANYRHWDEAVRLYVDDCLKGCEGPREKDFNMRWIASLVADCYRILMRGGVFLYPGDQRKGYHQGRLRLVYEANPIAFLVEQAGGAATDTVDRILEIAPDSLHQRMPVGVRLGEGSRAHRPLPHRSEQDRRTCAAVRQSRPVPCLTGGRHVRQAPHHLDHRLVRRGNDLGQAHLRADFPPREDRGGLHRGRCLSPLRPCRHEGKGRRGGEGGQSQLHPLQRRRQRARNPGGGVRGIWPQGQRQDPHLCP